VQKASSPLLSCPENRQTELLSGANALRKVCLCGSVLVAREATHPDLPRTCPAPSRPSKGNSLSLLTIGGWLYSSQNFTAERNTMKQASILVLAVFALTPGTFGQDGPTVKTEVMSAFVWGEDSPSGAVSSTIQDPLTGNALHTLSYAGIEVSSRLGFERFGTDGMGTFLNYTTTIVNSTESTLSVRYGGISVDGHAASLLSIVPPGQKLSKKQRKSKPDVVELGKIHCFTSGSLSSDNFFSANSSSQALTVAPRTALTVSSVIRDPRGYHPLRCSIDGCYPTGTIRYYIKVNNKDYVFVLSGRSTVYCGT